MIGFMTTIPIGSNIEASEEEFGKGLATAPLAGLVIGAILAFAAWVLGMFLPPAVLAVFLLVLYFLVTGGLHMDGLGDTFDGIFSGRSRERILEIMRDSRLGTNALLAVVSVVLLDTALLYSLKEKSLTIIHGDRFFLLVLLLFPVAGRIGSLVSASVSDYARSGRGLGKSFIEYCSTAELVTGLIIYFVIFLIAGGVPGLVAGIIPPVSAFVTVKLFSSRIGGATGDILGGVCEINQTVFLLEAMIIMQLY